MGKNSKILKDKKTIIIIAAAVVVAIIVAVIVVLASSNKTETADIKMLNSVLQKQSELTTAKLTLTGFCEYKDSGTKLLNRSDFKMVYDANVRAGINIKNVKITSDDVKKTIYIEIPKAEILESTVDPNTIKYFDEKFSFFNNNSKEDSDKAQSLASKNAIEQAKKSGLLEMADSQSESLIKGILSNAIPNGYKMEIKK